MGHDPSRPGHDCAGELAVTAEVGSATSRNGPGHRHIVKIHRGPLSVVVTAGISEHSAGHLAEQLTELLAGLSSDCPRCGPPAHRPGSVPVRADQHPVRADQHSPGGEHTAG
jgi:hypothetical protein